ncbi:MAG TPA: alpha/beta fold hydrolase, partial [Nakamurella sp.]
DTNHEIMDRAPDGGRVPLGRPVNNVRIYVVDEHLAPVPLGAPGAIVFSGICVGRGYVNDPERTRLSFSADPHHAGNRLYQAGDYGRWLPDGKLEFLGRRDSQVKIRGFRIEIGEIDNALLRVPGVRDAAVVVAERADHSKQLVAFYSGPEELGIDLLRDRLARSLPEYMVPSAFHRRECLPLTANSKIDRKALTLLAGTLDVAEETHETPITPTEHKLATAWAKVLGTPQDQIGRHDHFFFDCGGSSLSAVKLAITLDRAVSLADVTRHPVLADLAALIDGRTPRRTGLLQPLSEPMCSPPVALVCFPYAGGNAVNYQQMANALRDNGIAVYGVELPGHDVAVEPTPFASVEQTGEQVADEITRLGLRGVMLWGHSSGAVLAIETARRLQGGPVQVQQVFVGAQLIGDAATRHAASIELTGRSNADIADGLIADGGVAALGDLDAQGAERVGAAYRHDCVTAHRYLIDTLQTQQAPRLSTPVSVVVAADDPITADFAHRHRDWDVLAEHVALQVLPDGGHYFIRTRPAQTAQVVQQIADQLALSATAVPTR